MFRVNGLNFFHLKFKAWSESKNFINIFLKFLFKFQLANMKYSVSFRYIIRWFSTSIHHPVLITSSPTNSHHLFHPTPTHLSSGNQWFILHSQESVSWSLSLSLTLSCFFFFPFAHFFCFLNTTYEWNRMVFVFLWLILLSKILSSSIHVITNGKILFFFIAEQYSIICKIFHSISICILPIHQLMDTWAVSIIWLL